MRIRPEIHHLIVKGSHAAKLTITDYVERCVLQSGVRIMEMSGEEIAEELAKLRNAFPEPDPSKTPITPSAGR